MSFKRRTLIFNGAATALALTTLGRSASAQSRTQGITDTEILLGSHQDLSVLRAAEEQLKVHNMALVEQTSYKRGAIDFASQIAKLKAANVDLVVLGTIIRETAGACIEARKQGWNVDMMVTLAGANSAVVKIGGAAVEGLYAMTQFVAINAQTQTPALQGVLSRYLAKYKKEPDDGLIYGYMSVQLFAEAARRAGRNLNVDTLVGALEQIKGWTGIFEAAPVSFAANEHLGARSGILTRVKDGKFMPITGALTY
jgi:branched-chain amino acid transport system substrate-binding protein